MRAYARLWLHCTDALLWGLGAPMAAQLLLRRRRQTVAMECCAAPGPPPTSSPIHVSFKRRPRGRPTLGSGGPRTRVGGGVGSCCVGFFRSSACWIMCDCPSLRLAWISAFSRPVIGSFCTGGCAAHALRGLGFAAACIALVRRWVDDMVGALLGGSLGFFNPATPDAVVLDQVEILFRPCARVLLAWGRPTPAAAHSVFLRAAMQARTCLAAGSACACTGSVRSRPGGLSCSNYQ